MAKKITKRQKKAERKTRALLKGEEIHVPKPKKNSYGRWVILEDGTIDWEELELPNIKPDFSDRGGSRKKGNRIKYPDNRKLK